MIKSGKINIIFIAFLFLATSLSCAKYEEGPAFSLNTKKTRVSNKWDYQSVRNIQTDLIKYSEFENWNDLYDKENDFTRTIIYLSEITTYHGKWEFTDQKRGIVITYMRGEQLVTERYKIIRLTNDEFWIRDNEKEVHYITNTE